MEKDKLKVIGLATATTIVGVWVLINLVPMLMPARGAEEPNTPGWTLVQGLNDRLLEDDAFKDTSFTVDSEEPLKLRLVGAVYSEADLDDLRDYVKELVPQAECVIEVEVLRK